jgi:hypothetical protein
VTFFIIFTPFSLVGKIIIDAYSTDGTHEILSNMKQDGLKLFMYDKNHRKIKPNLQTRNPNYGLNLYQNGTIRPSRVHSNTPANTPARQHLYIFILYSNNICALVPCHFNLIFSLFS